MTDNRILFGNFEIPRLLGTYGGVNVLEKPKFIEVLENITLNTSAATA